MHADLAVTAGDESLINGYDVERWYRPLLPVNKIELEFTLHPHDHTISSRAETWENKKYTCRRKPSHVCVYICAHSHAIENSTHARTPSQIKGKERKERKERIEDRKRKRKNRKWSNKCVSSNEQILRIGEKVSGVLNLVTRAGRTIKTVVEKETKGGQNTNKNSFECSILFEDWKSDRRRTGD